MDFRFTNDIEFDTEITVESRFPEWIETDRLRLERLTEETLPPQKLKAARTANPGYAKYFTTRKRQYYQEDYNSVLDWYEYLEELWEEGSDAGYVMFRKDTDEFVGLAFIESVDLSRGRVYLGIWITSEQRGNGFSQERAEALTYVAFEQLDVDVVAIEVVPENIASIKSVEKYMKPFGGSFEGRIRNGTHIPSGDVRDIYQWSVTQEEFFDDDAEYTNTISPELPD